MDWHICAGDCGEKQCAGGYIGRVDAGVDFWSADGEVTQG